MNKLLIPFTLVLGATLPLASAQKRESKIKPTDTILIRISGVPQEDMLQISNPYQVSEKGTFPLLHIGLIQAEGFTPSQLSRRIEEFYVKAEIFTRPSVTVSTPEKAGPEAIRRVTISGEVRANQRAPFSDGMTLSDAIAQAGGFTEWADKKHVRLVRNGKAAEHNLIEAAKRPELDVPLQPGDKIFVQER